MEARSEIYQAWRDSFTFIPLENGRGNTVVIHQETVNEVLAGVKQFTMNMSYSPLGKA